MAESFITEQSPYPLSSWLSHVSLYEDYIIDFIIYPSYTLQSIACNFAFHPNFVDNYFKLNKVYKLWITDVKDDGMSVLPLEVGKVFNTNIKWDKPIEADIELFRRTNTESEKPLQLA